MYCPNCAAEASGDQKFCRTCGMELRAVAELVSTQAAITKPEKPIGGTLGSRGRAVIIWGFILTFGAAGVGAGLKILARDNIHPAGEFTPYVSVIAVLLAFFGIGLMCYPFLQMMSPGQKSRQAPSPKSEQTAKLRPEISDEPASVTEPTTDLLESVQARPNTHDRASQNDNS